MFDRLTKFFARPWGGIEFESFAARMEIAVGLVMLVSPNHLVVLRPLAAMVADYIPGQWVGLIWLLAGASTNTGIALELTRRPFSALLRVVGALFSMFLWLWVLFFECLSGAKSYPMVFIAVDLFIANIRFFVGAWFRPWSVRLAK